MPVNNYYVVLDLKTSEWYHGKEDISTRAPFKYHTATLYNDYMIIAFGNYCPLKQSKKKKNRLLYQLTLHLFRSSLFTIQSI